MLITHTHLKPDSKHTDERSATVKNAARNTVIDHFEQAMNAPQDKTVTQLKQQDLQKHSTTETAEKNEADLTQPNVSNQKQHNMTHNLDNNSAPSTAHNSAPSTTHNNAPSTTHNNAPSTTHNSAPSTTHNSAPSTAHSIVHNNSALASFSLSTNGEHNKKTSTSRLTENSMQNRQKQTKVQLSPQIANHTQVAVNTQSNPTQVKPTLNALKDNNAQEGISVPNSNRGLAQNVTNTAIVSKQSVAARQNTHKLPIDDKLQDINLGTQKAPLDNLANTPGNIILSNLKTPEPMSFERQQLISQLIDKVQILVPSLGHATQGQNRVQLVLDKGLLKGTEITISLQNNQLSVTLIHSSEHAQLLQHARPELLERLQKLNPELQVRIVTSSQEQASEHSQQDQGQQQESSQKSRVFDTWLEEQENA